MAAYPQIHPDTDEFARHFKFGDTPKEYEQGSIVGSEFLIVSIATVILAVVFLAEKLNGFDFILTLCSVYLALEFKAILVRIAYVGTVIYGMKKGKWESAKACFSDINVGKKLMCSFFCGCFFYWWKYEVEKTTISKELVFDIFFGTVLTAVLMHMFDLDSKPKMIRLIIDELNKTYTAYTLAQDYMNYLVPVLSYLEDTTICSTLSCRKLYIMLPLNCSVDRDPSASDITIEYLRTIEIEMTGTKVHKPQIGVYKIGENTVLLDFPLQLKTIKKIHEEEEDRNYQVRLFYRELDRLLKIYLRRSQLVEQRWHLIRFDYGGLTFDNGLGSGLGLLMKEVVLPQCICSPGNNGNLGGPGNGPGNDPGNDPGDDPGDGPGCGPGGGARNDCSGSNRSDSVSSNRDSDNVTSPSFIIPIDL